MKANLGDGAVFSIDAEGKDLSYQWQFFSQKRNEWINVSSPDYRGINTNKMTVPVTAVRNGIRYRCEVNDPYGSVFSDAATLIVDSTDAQI